MPHVSPNSLLRAARGDAGIDDGNPNSSTIVGEVPEDGISAVSWSQRNDLACASWDTKVRIWGVGSSVASSGMPAQLGAEFKASYKHAGPVLDCDFGDDGIRRQAYC